MIKCFVWFKCSHFFEQFLSDILLDIILEFLKVYLLLFHQHFKFHFLTQFLVFIPGLNGSRCIDSIDYLKNLPGFIEISKCFLLKSNFELRFANIIESLSQQQKPFFEFLMKFIFGKITQRVEGDTQTMQNFNIFITLIQHIIFSMHHSTNLAAMKQQLDIYF